MTYRGNLIRSQTGRIKVGIMVLMTMAALSGCATGKMNEQTKSWVRSHRDDKITQIPHQVFDLKAIVPSGQQPQVEVCLAKPGEISKVWPAGFFEGFSTGSSLAAAGIGATMLMPMAQGAAVGGAILLPALTTMGIMNSRYGSVLVKSMQEVDFPKSVEKLLQSNLAHQFPGKVSPNLEVQVLILGYGLFGSGGEQLWFHCDAQIQVKKAERIIFEDTITWQAQKRSDDIPPPRFAKLSEFAKNDGKLARDTFIEASEVLAAIIIKRLGGRT
jgi:hypothetical protein